MMREKVAGWMRTTPGLLLFISTLALAGAQGQVGPEVRAARRPAAAAAEISQYNKSIHLLTIGIRHDWNADEYAKAFGIKAGEGAPEAGVAECAVPLELLLRPRTAWDERPPLDVEVRRTLQECRRQRNHLLALSEAAPTPTN